MTADALERMLDIPFKDEYRPRRVPRPDVTLDRLIAASLLLVVITVHALNIAGWPEFFDDEGTYLSQAWATYDGQLAPYTYWYDHPPAGWIQLAALAWMPALFFDGPALVTGRIAMLVFTAASVILLYGVTRRLNFNRPFAALTVLLWGLSPLVIFEHRQVLLDVMAVPWLLGAFFLTLSPRKNLFHFASAGACLAIAILTKETMAIFAPAVFLALWIHTPRETRTFCVAAFTSVLVLFGMSYLLFATLKGELIPSLSPPKAHVSLIDAMLWQVNGRRGSGSILDANSGTRGMVQFWLNLDHVLIVGAAVSALPALFVRRLRPFAVAALIAMAMTLRSGYMPWMFVTAFLPFAAIIMVGLPALFWERLNPRLGSAWRRFGIQTLRVGIVALTGATLVSAVPAWATKYDEALTANVNVQHEPVVEWVKANVGRDETVMADNNYWLDLQQAGWTDPWTGVVWFSKVNLDPVSQNKYLPDGARSLDYLIWTKGMSESVKSNDLPISKRAFENSTVVQIFNAGSPQEVQIRKVNLGDGRKFPSLEENDGRAELFSPSEAEPLPGPEGPAVTPN